MTPTNWKGPAAAANSGEARKSDQLGSSIDITNICEIDDGQDFARSITREELRRHRVRIASRPSTIISTGARIRSWRADGGRRA